MAILVQLNNFFHDFAVALLFVSLFVLNLLYAYAGRNPLTEAPSLKYIKSVKSELITRLSVL